jgi:predicted  nucleic acid-binding Zn-ribbon protein
MLKSPIAEIKKQQIKISSNLRGLSTRYKEFNKQIADANKNIDTKIQEYNDKISSLYKSTEAELNGQYNMYKTGLSNDAAVVANLIKQTDSNNSNLSEKITNTKNETKQYADDTKQ